MKKSLYDDSDMKVVGETAENGTLSDDTADAAAQLWAREKSNGNVAKARRAGAILAGIVLSDDSFSPIDGIADEDLKTQRFVLANFAVEVGFDAFLPNGILSETAQDMFDHTLKITAPEWYDVLSQTGAISFYYLSIRSARGQSGAGIGDTFATLCGLPDNKACIKKGNALYLSVLARIKALADSLEFAGNDIG